MKQAKVAKKFGMSPTKLNALLSGKLPVTTIAVASKLSRILDMTIEEIAAATPETLKRRFDDLHEYGKDKENG